MKSIRNKKSSNSSFLSNHDLLQNFRNKSFKFITRQNSLSQLKSIPKKVAMIPKKSYQNILKQNKQNDPNQCNKTKSINSKTNTQRQKTSPTPQNEVHKIIKQLNFIYDQINHEEIQLKMILNKNIRKIKEFFITKNQSTTQNVIEAECINKQKQISQLKTKIETLQNKNEEQYKKIYLTKRENQQLKQKIQLHERRIDKLHQKISQLNRNHEQARSKPHEQKYFNHKLEQTNQFLSNSFQSIRNSIKNIAQSKQNQETKFQLLQKIIESQEQLINKQTLDFQQQNDELLILVKQQALNLQSFLNNNNKINNNNNHQQSKLMVTESDRNMNKAWSKPLISYQKSNLDERDFSGIYKLTNNYSNNYIDSQNSSFKKQNKSKSALKIDSSILRQKKQKRKHNQFSICLY